MNFKPGMNILTSSCYTRCKSRAPPTSGVGGASGRVDLVRKSPFYASPLGTGGLMQLLTLDLWSRRPKLLINQARSLGLLRPWNGDSLKNGKKKMHFAQSGPFSHILPHIVIYTCVCTHNTCTTCTCKCMSYSIATYPPIIHTYIHVSSCIPVLQFHFL